MNLANTAVQLDSPTPDGSSAGHFACPGRDRTQLSRILIATVNRPAGSTGVHTHTRTLHDGLGIEGYSAEIISPFSGSRLWEPLFVVRPLIFKRLHPTSGTLWYRRWHMAALRANLRKALRGAPVAHIVAQCPPSARVAMDVLSQLGLRDDVGVTMVCHFNGSEADEYRDQGALRGEAHVRVKAQEERVLREVDRVVYVSSWARQLVEQQRGIRTRASSVVWNGISELSARHASISRADLGLSESDLVLINVGTLEPRKNQLGLLQVFARIVAEHPHAKLLLAGEGPHRPLIEAAAVELNIASNVKLLGHRRNVAELLTVADLYVHFASAENCPISLIEAARAGLPWAAKPVGGVCELLNALGGGVALDLDSIDRSMQALRPLLASKDHRRALGEQARAQFATGFTQSAMVRAYVRALGLGQVGSGQ